MDTVGCVNEISALTTEITSLSKSLKQKKERLSELQTIFDTWLKKTGRTEVEYNGKVIYRITKPKTIRLKKSEKDEKLIELLENFGITDCKYALEKIKQVQKGDAEETTQICIDDKQTYEKKKSKRENQKNKNKKR